MQIHPTLLIFYSFSGFAEPDCLAPPPPQPPTPHPTLFVVSHANRIMHYNVAIRHVQMLIKEDKLAQPWWAIYNKSKCCTLITRQWGGFSQMLRFVAFSLWELSRVLLLAPWIPHTSLKVRAGGIVAIFIWEPLWLDNSQIASQRLPPPLLT